MPNEKNEPGAATVETSKVATASDPAASFPVAERDKARANLEIFAAYVTAVRALGERDVSAAAAMLTIHHLSK
jgi:hypothetical protein